MLRSDPVVAAWQYLLQAASSQELSVMGSEARGIM
jgi:hypothetical protein